MYIQGRTQMIRGAKSYEEAITRIADCGFDGVEINIYDYDFHLNEEFFHPGFGKRIKDYLQKCGMKSCSVGAHMDYTESPENMQKVMDAIHVVHELGAEVMIITGAFRREGEALKEQWKKQIECMKILAAQAGENQVKLAIEYEPGFVIHNSDLLLNAIKEVGDPVIGVNADIGHFFLEEQDPMAGIEKLGPYIMHAHLENMKRGVHNHLVPWVGDMDLEMYAQKFHAIGFDGCASLDVYQYNYEEIAKESIQYLKKYF